MLEFDQFRLQPAGFDRLNGAAHRVDFRDLVQRFALELADEGSELLAAVENVVEFKQIGLVSHDLLQTKRPLLIEGARQSGKAGRGNIWVSADLHPECAQ